ncbi:hypothetical protein CC80DRAFT_520100 [Byssothecium circinans]|uniref:Uncharacterized protein n=1 Tax=Byssothecium circinans TaxID=147558 RepID=A0A6A5TH27_9PLEO|nr:hypothetical protein CC80DRAFT_520100 [Byssothecium circinans]
MIARDIRVYLEHELTTIREEWSLPLEWPKEKSIQTLVNMLVPLFIFATMYETKDVSKLSMTYLPILNPLFTTQSKKEKRNLSREFQEIVGSIVVLESPLSINSLACLLGKASNDVTGQLRSLHSVLSIPNRNDAPVRLLHLSFREFLVDTSNEESPFWVDERVRNERLASYCLELMSSPDGLRQNMCGLQPGTLRSEIAEGKITRHLSSELQYACRYWVNHLKQSQRPISDKGTTDTFLQKHFLHWLEAMSLIGDTTKCIYLLETLYAPLQLYSSALIFALEASIVRRAFVDEMSGSIRALSKREDDWDACRSVLEGHTDWVSAVAFSRDGQLVASASHDSTVRLVASASHDSTVRVWEAATGSCRSVLEGHTDWVTAVAFSPDGQYIQTNCGDIPLHSPTTPSPSFQRAQCYGFLLNIDQLVLQLAKA